MLLLLYILLYTTHIQVTYTTTNIGLESGLVAEGIKKAFDAAAILGMLYIYGICSIQCICSICMCTCVYVFVVCLCGICICSVCKSKYVLYYMHVFNITMPTAIAILYYTTPINRYPHCSSPPFYHRYQRIRRNRRDIQLISYHVMDQYNTTLFKIASTNSSV